MKAGRCRFHNIYVATGDAGSASWWFPSFCVCVLEMDGWMDGRMDGDIGVYIYIYMYIYIHICIYVYHQSMTSAYYKYELLFLVLLDRL